MCFPADMVGLRSLRDLVPPYDNCQTADFVFLLGGSD